MFQDVPHVLVVNDDEELLFLLKHAVIREFPHADIIAGRNAREALQLLEHRSVDAIITDNRMPEIDGVTLVGEIRKRNHTVPILMLTGSDQAKEAAFKAGVNAFVASANWDDIRRGIRGLLQARPG